MPSNRTQNYQLSQWESEDRVLRTDFNADNAKIDAAIKAVDTKADGKADASTLAALQSAVEDKASQSALASLQSTVSALQTTVAGKQNASSAVKLKAGTYTGDGQGSQTIPVGFTPKAVFVISASGMLYYNGYYYGGLAVTGHPATAGSVRSVEIVSGGFTVRSGTISSTSSAVLCNNSGAVFHYIALG